MRMDKDTKPQNVQPPEYDSNPFTISITGFTAFIKYAQGVFIATLILGLISFLLNVASYIADNLSSSNTSVSSDSTISAATSGEAGVAVIILFVSAFTIVVTIALVINTLYRGTVAAGTVAASHKRHVTFSQALSEMSSRFGTLFFATFISWLRIIGGYLIFIIPGIRAQLRYEAVPYIVLDNKDMTATEAVNESKRLYDQHLLEVLAIKIFGSFIPFIGEAFSSSGITMSYQQIKAYKDASQQKPDMHILNWVLLLAIGFFGLVLLALVAGAVLLYVSTK